MTATITEDDPFKPTVLLAVSADGETYVRRNKIVEKLEARGVHVVRVIRATAIRKVDHEAVDAVVAMTSSMTHVDTDALPTVGRLFRLFHQTSSTEWRDFEKWALEEAHRRRTLSAPLVKKVQADTTAREFLKDVMREEAKEEDAALSQVEAVELAETYAMENTNLKKMIEARDEEITILKKEIHALLNAPRKPSTDKVLLTVKSCAQLVAAEAIGVEDAWALVSKVADKEGKRE